MSTGYLPSSGGPAALDSLLDSSCAKFQEDYSRTNGDGVPQGVHMATIRPKRQAKVLPSSLYGDPRASAAVHSIWGSCSIPTSVASTSSHAERQLLATGSRSKSSCDRIGLVGAGSRVLQSLGPIRGAVQLFAPPDPDVGGAACPGLSPSRRPSALLAHSGALLPGPEVLRSALRTHTLAVSLWLCVLTGSDASRKGFRPRSALCLHETLKARVVLKPKWQLQGQPTSRRKH